MLSVCAHAAVDLVCLFVLVRCYDFADFVVARPHAGAIAYLALLAHARPKTQDDLTHVVRLHWLQL